MAVIYSKLTTEFHRVTSCGPSNLPIGEAQSKAIKKENMNINLKNTLFAFLPQGEARRG
jgi:hypothetical protein